MSNQSSEIYVADEDRMTPLCVQFANGLCRVGADMRKFAGLMLVSFVCLTASARSDWPDFRGPWCDGRTTAPGQTNLLGLPLHWSETENVKWKTPIPYRGWFTPVILNGQIWITTATVEGHDFFAICVDQETG